MTDSHEKLVAAPALLVIHVSLIDWTTAQIDAPTGVGFLYGVGLRIVSIRSRAFIYLFIFNLFNVDKLTYIFDIWR